jgi:hypothetical protein
MIQAAVCRGLRVLVLAMAVSAFSCSDDAQSTRADRPTATASSASTTAVATSPAEASETSAPPMTAVSEPLASFVNVASDAGLDRILYCGGTDKNHILESVGSGCAWIDYDEDGRLDVFLVNAWAIDDATHQVRERGRNALYRNLGNGRFEDVTDHAGVAGDDWGCGVCAGDFDNDGHVDLYVTNFGTNRLYRNRGDRTFEEIGAQSGADITGWSAGSAFFDADGDGWLDLYVAQYIDCPFDEVLTAERTNVWRRAAKVMVGPFGMRGGRDRFLHNNRDGTFTDTTDEVGMTDEAESYGLGVVASDLDNDGDVDVYVANDSNPNFLYRNDGDGTFTEVGAWSGAGVSAEGRPQGSMGVDAGDLDGDGLQELVTTNFAHDFTTVYKNEGDLFFGDVSAMLQMKLFSYVQVSWGCAFFDYDLDSHLDLLILNGHIYPQVDAAPDLGESYKQLPTLLRNVEGEFQNVSRNAGPGMEQAESMRGLAVGDYDDDGRPDLLITAMDAPPLLLRNETPPRGHWSKVRLLNQHGSPAINAQVLLTAGGRTHLREVRSGSTYCSQNSFDLHFGLGEVESIETIEIRWPGGQTMVVDGQLVDQILQFVQPEAQR